MSPLDPTPRVHFDQTMSSPRKLQMERLSPIPPSGQRSSNLNLSDSSRATPDDSCVRQKDYTIEPTSSPEIAKLPLSRKIRKSRTSSRSCTRKITKKCVVTTPLSGLVSRKAVTLPKCSSNYPLVRAEKELGRLPTIEEAPLGDGEELLSIETFSSPGQSNVLDRKRHLEPVVPKMSFLPQLNVSTSSPLPNVVIRNTSILKQPGGPGFAEDETAVMDQEVNGIECFVSPAKHAEPLSLDVFNLSGIDLKSSLTRRRGNISSFDGGWKQHKTGSIEKKKRKRALDFSSYSGNLDSDKVHQESRFVVPTVDGAECYKIAGFAQEKPEEADSMAELGAPTTGKCCESRNPQPNEPSLSGFVVSSSLASEPDERVGPIDIEHSEKVQIVEEYTDENYVAKDVPFFIINHDSSSDDSTVADVQLNESNDSGPSIFADSVGVLSPSNAKRDIQSFTTPSKGLKIFSEAIAIDNFGSPTPHDTVVEPVIEEGRIEVSSYSSREEEFVDESEQLRPLKRRKRGSLMERASSVIGRIDASNSLFDYELKAGLRPLKGKLVSSSLVVCKKWETDRSSVFLVCKKLSLCSDQSDYPTAQRASLVVVIAKKIPKELTQGSVVLLHFPIYVIYCESLKLPYVLADNQLVLHPTEPKIQSTHLPSIEEAYRLLNSHPSTQSNPIAYSKVIATNKVNTLFDLNLTQSIVEEVLLTLQILHVVRLARFNKVVVLCRDEDLQYCWMELTNERDIKRATALESLHILKRGSSVEVKGFHVNSVQPANCVVNNLVKYCSNEPETIVEQIFTISPIEPSWIISSTGSSKNLTRAPTSIRTILSESEPAKRYFVEVQAVETTSDTGNFAVRDVNGQAIPFKYDASWTSSGSLIVPFFLDAAYFSEGKLCSDDYTKLITKKNAVVT